MQVRGRGAKPCTSLAHQAALNSLPPLGSAPRLVADVQDSDGGSAGAVLPPQLAEAAVEGLHSAMGVGLVQGYPLMGVKAELVAAAWNADTTVAAMRACAGSALVEALRAAGPLLLEPMMAMNAEVCWALPPLATRRVLRRTARSRDGE